MVQSISQYEFIYEYILDYLSSSGIIDLKHPRNTFGLDEDDEEITIKVEDGDDGLDYDDSIKISIGSHQDLGSQILPSSLKKENDGQKAETTERTQKAKAHSKVGLTLQLEDDDNDNDF